MQKTAEIAIIVLVVAGSAAASPMAFDMPGEFRADWIGAHQIAWALMVFKNGTAADFRASSTHEGFWTNASEISPVRFQHDGYSFVPYPLEENGTEVLPAPFQVNASFPPERSGSLFVVADQMELNLHDVRGTLSTKDAKRGFGEFSRSNDTTNRLYRAPGVSLGASVVVVADPRNSQGGGAAFNLVAHGGTYIEWYNAVTSCPSSQSCPAGGGPEITSLPAPPGYKVTSERHTYEVLRGQGIELQGRGTLDYVLYGSTDLDLTIDGSVRLPLARGQGASCQECAAPDNQTFSATGNVTLQGLRIGSKGLEANVGGDIETARFDETPIDPASLFGMRGAAVGAAVLGGGLVVFKLLKLLWPALFTRHKDDALTNERRRRLYDYILENPGVHFREALRGALVPAGSGRHHLTRLVRAGLVVERRHHNSVCLFPNDSRLASWQELAALRDPDYRLLYEWVEANPEKSQNEIVAAFAALHGWKRGVTRKRVARLAAEGLLRCRDQGRYKIYSTSKHAQAATGGGVPGIAPGEFSSARRAVQVMT